MIDIFEIRRLVFVLEQAVDPNEEYDEHEDSSIHFLAKFQGIPCGTCRYRITQNGIKMERFAVLKEFRGKDVGSALLQTALSSIGETNQKVYLHAQTHAEPFYVKHGFIAEGELFYEAGIPHYKMSLS
jgi:predicted GNAT family N-acyltransferase